MSEIWETKALGSLCNFVRGPFGGSLKKSCFKSSGYAIYEQQHAIYDQFKDIRYFIDESKYLEMQRFELSAGDLIMSCSGTMGKVAIVPDGIPKGIINQALLKLSPGKNILVEFLKYWMSSPNFQDQLTNLSQGVAIKNVASVKVLKEIQIRIPSVNEQKRIVLIVDEAFESIDIAIENTKNNLTNANELFESYLNAVFINKGDRWVSKKLGDICDFLNGFAFKSTDAVNNSNVQLIRMGNLYQNILDLERNPVFYPDNFQGIHSRYILSEGDLIMSLTGTVDKKDYGYTVEVPETERVLLLNQRIAKFTNINTNYIDKGFFLYLLRSKMFLDDLYQSSRGVRQANLSSLSMKLIQLSLPPIELQQSLVLDFRSLESEAQRLKAIYHKKLAALTELKQSILQKAFTGELTADSTNQTIKTAKEVIAA
jgi:type I restriction enzyme, S subunit